MNRRAMRVAMLRNLNAHYWALRGRGLDHDTAWKEFEQKNSEYLMLKTQKSSRAAEFSVEVEYCLVHALKANYCNSPALASTNSTLA